MKSPLRYQVTQYDCGPTTMTNAILYLFEREEIPPDLVRHIGLCTLDSYDRNGHCGMCGTTGAAMRYFGTWLNEQAPPLSCMFFMRSVTIFLSHKKAGIWSLPLTLTIAEMRFGEKVFVRSLTTPFPTISFSRGMSSTTPAGTFILWEKLKPGRPWSSGVKLLRIFILSEDPLLNHLESSA